MPSLHGIVTLDFKADPRADRDLTVNEIVTLISSEQKASSRPDPEVVLLRGQSSPDIHDLMHVATNVSMQVPGVMLGIAFDDG